MASESVRVCDLEIGMIANNLSQRSKIDNVLEKYVRIMKKVSENAVPDGEVHELIERLVAQAQEILSVCNGIGGKAASDANSFLEKIDSVDLELYQKGW